MAALATFTLTSGSYSSGGPVYYGFVAEQHPTFPQIGTINGDVEYPTPSSWYSTTSLWNLYFLNYYTSHIYLRLRGASAPPANSGWASMSIASYGPYNRIDASYSTLNNPTYPQNAVWQWDTSTNPLFSGDYTVVIDDGVLAATTVDITSVGDTTPNENTSDQISATTTTDGSVSISSYAWSSTGGITFNSTTIQSPTITFPNVTSNTSASVTCVVTDSLGDTASDTQNYTVQFLNQGPLATISGDQVVVTNNLASFSADGSYDPDGSSLLYKFDTVKDSVVVFNQAYSYNNSYSFTPTSEGTYTTTLTVKDPSNATATALITTTVSSGSGPGSGSGGGYGFEVYNDAGETVIRSSELLIRKIKAVTLDANGNGSTTVTLPDTNSTILGAGLPASAGTDTGINLTVTSTNGTATVNIAAPNYTKAELYMVK